MEKAPVFVKIDKYKEISGLIGDIRATLNEAKKAIEDVESIKAEEDKEVAAWKAELEAAESRLSNVEDVLR